MNIQYHYCTFKNFRSIINSQTLWLCNLTETNDQQEVHRVYQIVWGRIKERLLNSSLDCSRIESQIQLIDSVFTVQEECDIPYGCCFCAENDLVAQWNEYGARGKGVALGFDFDWFEEHGVQCRFPTISSLFSHSLGFETVNYDSKQMEDELYILFREALAEHGDLAWIKVIVPTMRHFAAFIKNPTFRDERETRIVFYPFDLHHSHPALSDRIEEPFPHYCLRWRTESSSALRSVMIGSRCPADEKKVAAMLQKAGITEPVTMDHSEYSYVPKKHST